MNENDSGQPDFNSCRSQPIDTTLKKELTPEEKTHLLLETFGIWKTRDAGAQAIVDRLRDEW